MRIGAFSGPSRQRPVNPVRGAACVVDGADCVAGRVVGTFGLVVGEVAEVVTGAVLADGCGWVADFCVAAAMIRLVDSAASRSARARASARAYASPIPRHTETAAKTQ